MAAVRAHPSQQSWHVCLLSSSSRGVEGFDRLERVQRVHHVLGGDAGAGHQLAAGLAGRRHERHGPEVLVDEQHREPSRLQHARRLGEVVVAQQPGPGPGQVLEAAEAFRRDLGQVEGVGVAGRVLADHEDVVDADDAAPDEVHHLGGGPPGQVVVRELDEHEVHRSVHGFACHAVSLSRALGSGPTRTSRRPSPPVTLASARQGGITRSG